MERATEIATSFFKRLEYAVEDIPVADGKKGEKGKRSDLDVFDGKNRYIVEVKEKAQADSQVEYSTVDVGESIVNVRQEPHLPSNRLDGVLKHAAKQLAETPCADGDFKLIWLHSDGYSANMTITRALYTYYGVAQLVPRSQPGEGVNCAYFYNCTAFACPSINGLIVVQNDSLQLGLNEFSDNYQTFKTSDLVRKLGEAVYDPSNFENKAGTMVVRSDVSRSSESEVLAELERTTGVRYSVTSMNHYEFS